MVDTVSFILLGVLCYPIMCIYDTISALKRCSVRLYLQLFVEVLMSYFHYVCLCTHGGVQHILCCVLFCLCSSFVPYGASFSRLCCVLFCLCSSFVPYVASFSVLCCVLFCLCSSFVPYVASFSCLYILIALSVFANVNLKA